MSFDPHKNFAYSTVATAPSPATSGTSLVVAAGDGTLFPAPGTDGDFNVTVWPAGAIPTKANAEICRVTARSTDTFTITRAQEGTSARTIVVGDQIALTITAKVITDIESATSGGGGGGAGTGEETLDTIASSGSSTTIDVANGAVQDLTLTANCAITLASPASGSDWSIVLRLHQDGTGSRTVTWPTITWLGTGIPPTLQTAAGAVDCVVLSTPDGGTTWYGVAQTSASGLRSGTSFPGTPSDGDLFYRTDRRILYEFNSSAALWLSLDRHYLMVGSYQSAASVTNTNAGKATVGEDIYIEKWLCTTQVGGTNNSSNKWTVTLFKQSPAEASTSVVSFDTGADGSSATPHSVAVNAEVVSASFPILLVFATKTGAPGNLELMATVVVCRSVG